MKKNKIFYIFILIFSVIVFFVYIFINNRYVQKDYDFIISDTLSNDNNEIEDTKYVEEINNYVSEYNNEEIVAILDIENTNFKTVIPQHTDNDYYLNHLPNKVYGLPGSIFLDYRVNVDDDRILLIYGHSSTFDDYPFEIIENYLNEEYYKSHKYIYLFTKNKVRKYEVFSSYVETLDFDYMKIKFNDNEELLTHYLKLKNKSLYDVDMQLTSDDNILILQTCSTQKDYELYSKKYMLVIAKEIN